jgi:hypothetical protein
MVAASAAGDAAPGQSAGEGTATNVASVTNVPSANWAGYAVTGTAGSFTSVSSSWAQPTVSYGAASTFSSFWVGLDGDGTPTVEQTGTEADCANGTATYQGWYEFFPNAPVFFANAVQPGWGQRVVVAAPATAVAGATTTTTISGFRRARRPWGRPRKAWTSPGEFAQSTGAGRAGFRPR